MAGLTTEQIGAAGAAMVPRDSRLIRRHVERIEMVNADVFRRTLTVDVVLPERGHSVGRRPSGDARYYIPFARVAKWPPIGDIDLLDETGASLPLINREESIAISQYAMAGVAKRTFGGDVSTDLRNLLDFVLAGDGAGRDMALALALRTLEDMPDPLGESQAFASVLTELGFNVLVWLELCGRPGDRRIVRLAYDAYRWERGFRLGERPVRASVRARRTPSGTAVRTFTFSYLRPGVGDPRYLTGQLWRGLMTQLGFSALDIGLFDLYTGGCGTYHLELRVPSGIEIRDLRIAPLAANDRAVSSRTADRAHLKMSGSQPGAITEAWLTVRPGAGGILARAVIAMVLTALLLWAFDQRPEELHAAARHGEEAGGLILLAVPSLLALVVVRGREHPFASFFLRGMRLIALWSIVMAVAAASAVVGVHFRGVTLGRTFHWAAIAATAGAAMVTLAWALSVPPAWSASRRIRGTWRSKAVYVGSGLVAMVLATVVVAVGTFAPHSVHRLEALFFIALLVAAGVLAFVAGHGHEVEGRAIVTAPRLVGVAGLVTLVPIAFMGFDLTHAHVVPRSGSKGEWEAVWQSVLPIMVLLTWALSKEWVGAWARGRRASAAGTASADRSPGPNAQVSSDGRE
ncbi:MAG: hypothetical protein ACJ760_15560 [Thermoleophilaceae bacterium]